MTTAVTVPKRVTERVARIADMTAQMADLQAQIAKIGAKRDAEVVKASRADGMTYKFIAEHGGMSPSNVWKILKPYIAAEREGK